MIRRLFITVITLIIGITLFYSPTSFGQAQSATDEITVLFTHDLHDNLYPFQIDEDGVAKKVGGFSRLATAIKEEQEKHEHTVLVDGGDYSMGTLFQTIFSTHSPTLRILGKLDYDAVSFGNHEFDFRAEGLAESLMAAKESGEAVPDIVAANVIYPTEEDGSVLPEIEQLKKAMETYGVKKYKIIERGGIKIGMFGLVGADAASNAPMSGVEFADIVESSKETVAQLKEEGADLIIAISHSGTSDQKKVSEDEELAEKVPEIDVIVSAHTHTFLYDPIVINDTVIGSTGEYGQNLGIMQLKRNNQNRWDLVDYELKQITEDIEEDEEISNLIEQFKTIVQKEYLDYFEMEFNQVLAYSPFHFTDYATMYDRHGEDPLGNIIGDAYIETVEKYDDTDAEPVTAAVVPIGTIRASFYEGNITVSDVFNVSSLGIGPDKISGYPIVEVYLTGKELKTVAEVDASVSPLMPSAQLYVAGLSYTFNPNRLIFNKVTDVQIQHKDGTTQQIDDNKLYRIVAGLYSGQMLPVVSEKSFGLLSLVPKKADGSPITDFEEHILYMDNGAGEKREIKEWYAIADYIRSFDVKGDLPEVPNYYAQLQNRKIVDDSKSLPSLLKNSNGIALTIYAIGLTGIILLVLIVRFILKRRKARRFS